MPDAHLYINKENISTPMPGYATFAELNTAHLTHNVGILQKQAGGIHIMAVVKADAYGHGVAAISTHLVHVGIRHFMVATLDEALELRSLQPEVEILVASPPYPENLGVYEAQRLDVSVSSDETACAVLAAAQKGIHLNVHVKLETGMNRLGIALHRAPETIGHLLGAARVNVAGIWSHLATAGDVDPSFALQQIKKAYAIVDQFPSFNGYFHVGNSGALLNLRDHIGLRKKELIRLGGALLGIPASQKLANQFELKPVMSLKSRVVHIKTLDPGDSVSYGRTWLAPHATRLAVVGAGYADGYPSALSGKASVFIHDKPYPIVGRVCMDMFMIDLGVDNNNVRIDDEVLLFGSQHVNIYDLGKQAGLVHYEICCRIPTRVRRRLV